MRGKLWSLALYLFVLGFILNLLGIVTHVTVSAFAKRWFGTPLPPSFTTDWFVYAWTNFDLGRVLTVMSCLGDWPDGKLTFPLPAPIPNRVDRMAGSGGQRC